MLDGLHRSRDVARRVEDEFKKRLSLSSLRRLLRTAGFRYKRIRRSVRHLRSQADYEFFQGEMSELKILSEQGHIDLFYFDEMGLSRQAVVPYGWQPLGKSSAYVPTTPSGNLTTLAFMSCDQRLRAFTCQGAATADLVVACFDEFAQGLTKPTVVVLDNASIHRSRAFKHKIAQWRKQNLLIQFLPPYCPELNLIEILWKHIKYHWLEVQDFGSAQSLANALDHILTSFGEKYRITFA